MGAMVRAPEAYACTPFTQSPGIKRLFLPNLRSSSLETQTQTRGSGTFLMIEFEIGDLVLAASPSPSPAGSALDASMAPAVQSREMYLQSNSEK
jgi:hypothetical protein